MTIKIPYPKSLKGYSLNDIYAGKHWSLRKKDADYWRYSVWHALQEQGIRKKIISKPVTITFSWCDRLDVDNHAYMGKLIVDALKGYLLQDDSKKYYKEVRHKYHDKKYIKVEVEW